MQVRTRDGGIPQVSSLSLVFLDVCLGSLGDVEMLLGSMLTTPKVLVGVCTAQYHGAVRRHMCEWETQDDVGHLGGRSDTVYRSMAQQVAAVGALQLSSRVKLGSVRDKSLSAVVILCEGAWVPASSTSSCRATVERAVWSREMHTWHSCCCSRVRRAVEKVKGVGRGGERGEEGGLTQRLVFVGVSPEQFNRCLAYRHGKVNRVVHVFGGVTSKASVHLLLLSASELGFTRSPEETDGHSWVYLPCAPPLQLVFHAKLPAGLPANVRRRSLSRQARQSAPDNAPTRNQCM